MEGAFSFWRTMNNRKNAARTERLQQRVQAGFVSAHFPGVKSIIISMMYNQSGIGKSLPRTVNFSPDSSAFFRIDCLNKDCVDGGFDLSNVLNSMIRDRREAAKGQLSCEGNGASADHSDIVYKVAIKYA
jgi:hypothetical protein